jgi:hypothetical protein
MSKIRQKYKKLTVVILLIALFLPLANITSAVSLGQKGKEITALLLVERPEKQVVVDEILDVLDTLGLIVTATYFYDYDEWVAHSHVHGHEYDLVYGGYSYTWDIDNIFQLAWFGFILNLHMFNNDDPNFDKIAQKLWDMFNDAMANPEIATEDYIKKMINIFHKWEKQLWLKKYIMPLVQWEGSLEPYGLPIPVAKLTETIGLKCIKGSVFSNLALRWAFYSLIDRSIFLDYHAVYNPYVTYTVYHLFQLSTHHDTTLLNW